MRTTPTEAALRARIAAFIDSHGAEGDRLGIALDLWAWQVAHNPYYRRISAGTVPTALHEIPAVPVQLFRELVLTCFPLEDARVTFRTSGTTGGRGVVRPRGGLATRGLVPRRRGQPAGAYAGWPTGTETYGVSAAG